YLHLERVVIGVADVLDIVDLSVLREWRLRRYGSRSHVTQQGCVRDGGDIEVPASRSEIVHRGRDALRDRALHAEVPLDRVRNLLPRIGAETHIGRGGLTGRR